MDFHSVRRWHNGEYLTPWKRNDEIVLQFIRVPHSRMWLLQKFLFLFLHIFWWPVVFYGWWRCFRLFIFVLLSMSSRRRRCVRFESLFSPNIWQTSTVAKKNLICIKHEIRWSIFIHNITMSRVAVRALLQFAFRHFPFSFVSFFIDTCLSRCLLRVQGSGGVIRSAIEVNVCNKNALNDLRRLRFGKKKLMNGTASGVECFIGSCVYDNVTPL